ncbi:SAM-dependent methyltransferase [Cohnella lubricantis]|uniref:SAM-dependent methyltransferase n=1 Tax=Cohnella lubricantis TaxID=2163172 RepID=A0A841TF52_9BACL|nr:SAM-dependent methyltransferase [Cohnella lubricantis]MBB6678705.1 SAM-dependent methyltransferase [Cohnella lubricantis]MBP2119774.1 SAM-dependent MidA family methyltransferase [Cohnella lubricantis]
MRQPQERTPLAAAIEAAIASSSRRGETTDGKLQRCLTFRDYMEICLYDPAHGYYRSGSAARVGREGDFYTSAYVGDVMGERLGNWLFKLAQERFGVARRVELVDWGGGTGRLASQMLGGWKEAAGEAAEAEAKSVRLTVVDRSPEHRRQAAALLSEPIRAGEARVMDESAAMAEPWRERPAIVVANELIDAMPVHRICVRQGRVREWGVTWNEAKERLEACWTEPSTTRLAEELARMKTSLREGQTAEIGLDGADWVAALAGKLGDAVLVLIDYGDEARELTAEHRMEGTLMCYRRHVASTDPFAAPGEQDITAHVNFTLLSGAAEEAGWQRLWYGTQRRFLTEAGVLEQLAAHDSADPFHPAARRNRAIRQLLLSDGMSELFKVLVLARTKG